MVAPHGRSTRFGSIALGVSVLLQASQPSNLQCHCILSSVSECSRTDVIQCGTGGTEERRERLLPLLRYAFAAPVAETVRAISSTAQSARDPAPRRRTRQ